MMQYGKLRKQTAEESVDKNKRLPAKTISAGTQLEPENKYISKDKAAEMLKSDFSPAALEK